MKIGERITFERVKSNGQTPCEGCFFNDGDNCFAPPHVEYFNCCANILDNVMFVEVKDDKA